MTWKPYSIPHGHSEAVEAARYLRNYLESWLGVPWSDNPRPHERLSSVYGEQLRRCMRGYEITPEELNRDRYGRMVCPECGSFDIQCNSCLNSVWQCVKCGHTDDGAEFDWEFLTGKELSEYYPEP